ncbi:radical SAM protein [Tabrizicola sp. BL-A-41-H6]|uniref:radical SAM protein n=1 Tax=Tabrizicola sp. BL-A-41-H6 TaxID=3421107 RepID=UPI003D66A043
MNLKKIEDVGLGDLPPTIAGDVLTAFDSENRKFNKFWQITLKVTDACALRCSYCTQYVKSGAVELTPRFLNGLVDLLKTRSIAQGYLLTGGEPLHHRNFEAILRPFSESSAVFDVNTSLASSRRKVQCLLNALPRTIRYSIHSMDAEESRNFNGTESWETVISNARMIADSSLRPPRVEINTHVSNTNFRSTVQRLEWISEVLMPDDINIFPVYDLKEMQLDKRHAEEFYSSVLPAIIDLAENRKFAGLKTRALRLLGDPSRYGKEGPKYVNHSSNCHAGRSILYIDNFQDVYACVSQQIHRKSDGALHLGHINEPNDLIDIVDGQDPGGFDPNGNAVCSRYCPLFFSMVNNFVRSL